MGKMKNTYLISIIFTWSFCLAFTSQATTYEFNIETDGTNLFLTNGSDDPIATDMMVGDTLTFSYKTTGEDYWIIEKGNQGFLFNRFVRFHTTDPRDYEIYGFASRTGDWYINFRLDGTLQYSENRMGSLGRYVHIGNLWTSPKDLRFDAFDIFYRSTAIDYISKDISHHHSYFESLDFQTGRNGTGINSVFTYIHQPNPIPEPNTTLLFTLGLLGLAGVNRRIRINKGN